MRLKECREAAGLSQKEVAVTLRVRAPSVSNWERGITNPTYENLMQLANLYHVTIDYLTGRSDDPAVKTEMPAAVRVPVFGTVPAGIPLEAIEDVLDWEEIPAAMLHGGKEFFALEVKGDSMWPDYQPGDRVIVQLTPVCNSGDVCVVYVNGYAATLKKVRLWEDGAITLIPRNPEYPEKHYTREEVATLPLTIAGVVVEIRRRVK